MAKRKYLFALPHTTTWGEGMKIVAGEQTAEVQALLAQVPAALRAKIEFAGPMTHVTLTKADLDSIPDAAWAHIASKLGLEWSAA